MSERLEFETRILETIERYLVSLRLEIDQVNYEREKVLPDTRKYIKLSMRLEDLECQERIISRAFTELQAKWSWK